ncbi:MAG: Crp/Fnr family transcriptional regulator [Sphingomonas sp.]|uniref:Crp/Fnr family transcriptional regulator n=1 Tax=Sphingomonas sp. TaxID=28214 RepID=UPI00182DB803|nr:Crp/Fnr family transcriptional regulator [Sphingomonas sp.]MBA3667811.1 Crp/Fnr family transcriptional regulator [Sphingomonas sp.]
MIQFPDPAPFDPAPWPPSARDLPEPPAPPQPLIAKLRRFVRLEECDLDALRNLAAYPKNYRSGHILIHENAVPDHVYLLVRGMACRYKLLPSGQRQILGYLIPGDLCDIHFATLGRPDHSVSLLADSAAVKIPTRRIVDLLADHPQIERALSLAAILDIAILREWLLNVGQRNALQKLSHFFCEMKVRLEAIGEVSFDGSFEMPVNQSTLADTTGLTPVHVNRTLQRLRSDGLIKLCHRRLSILDPDRLAAIAEFDAHYLQIRQCQR